MSGKENCGALWLHESKNGAKYLSGMVEFDGVKRDIVVFKNTFKEEDKHPDYRIFPSTPKEERYPAEKAEAKEDDSSIPF